MIDSLISAKCDEMMEMIDDSLGMLQGSSNLLSSLTRKAKSSARQLLSKIPSLPTELNSALNNLENVAEQNLPIINEPEEAENVDCSLLSDDIASGSKMVIELNFKKFIDINLSKVLKEEVDGVMKDIPEFPLQQNLSKINEMLKATSFKDILAENDKMLNCLDMICGAGAAEKVQKVGERIDRVKDRNFIDDVGEFDLQRLSTEIGGLSSEHLSNIDSIGEKILNISEKAYNKGSTAATNISKILRERELSNVSSFDPRKISRYF